MIATVDLGEAVQIENLIPMIRVEAVAVELHYFQLYPDLSLDTQKQINPSLWFGYWFFDFVVNW